MVCQGPLILVHQAANILEEDEASQNEHEASNWLCFCFIF